MLDIPLSICHSVSWGEINVPSQTFLRFQRDKSFFCSFGSVRDFATFINFQ